MAWMRCICGRIKSDFRYSAGRVYNNFPWVENPSPNQIERIEQCAKVVLEDDVRMSGITIYSRESIRIGKHTSIGGNVKIFNNSDVRNITNLSSLNSTAVCDLSLPASLPLDVVEPVLKAVLPKIRKEHPDMFPEAPSYDGIQALSGSSMTLRVTAVVKEVDRFNAARVINRYLKEVADTLSGK